LRGAARARSGGDAGSACAAAGAPSARAGTDIGSTRPTPTTPAGDQPGGRRCACVGKNALGGRNEASTIGEGGSLVTRGLWHTARIAMHSQEITESVAAACAPAGFDLVQPFQVGWYNAAVHPAYRLPDFARPRALGILIGNTRALWPRLLAAVCEQAALRN